MRTLELGPLKARVLGGPDGNGGGHGPVVVLCHGFGAPGDDLVPLSGVLGVPEEMRFVFPEAPLELSLGFGESRAWWMLDMARLEQALATGDLRDLSNERPAGLDQARQALFQAVAALDGAIGPGMGPPVLGGFSQGAMLACDLALREPVPLGGLVLLSGTLLCEPEWALLMPSRRGLPVFQSHGRQDPLLPFALAARLRDRLTAAGLDVDFIDFAGGHELPPPVLARLGRFLDRVTAESPARGSA